MKASGYQALYANAKGRARLGLLLSGLVLVTLLMTGLERANRSGSILAAQLEETPTPSSTPTPRPTAPPMAHADCGAVIPAQTFVDQNGNRRRDRWESPLPGVSIYLDTMTTVRRTVDRQVTDGEGSATLHAFIPGCLDTALELYVDVPQGYDLTTPQRIDPREGEPYIFGFRRLSALPANPVLPGMPTTGRLDDSQPASASGW
jgi:hypothetical protein